VDLLHNKAARVGTNAAAAAMLPHSLGYLNMIQIMITNK